VIDKTLCTFNNVLITGRPLVLTYSGTNCTYITVRKISRLKTRPDLPPNYTSDSDPIDVHPTPTSLQFRVLYSYVCMHLYVLGSERGLQPPVTGKHVYTVTKSQDDP
jgi:hypothetical protein